MNREAYNRYATGKGFIESAKMVAYSPHRDSEARRVMTVLSLSMLIGFALEVLLKAWLLASGTPSAEVRRFGHRLGDLYEASTSQGLPTIPGLSHLAEIFGKGHEDFTFRYMNDGDSITVVDWRAAFTILDALDVAVDTKVGASASRGLTPGH